LLGKVPQPISEIVDEIAAVRVVRTDIVIVDRFLDQPTVGDRGIDCMGRCVSLREERAAVDLADKHAIELDARVRSNHLQVKNDSARLHSADHIAEDVHDVLGLHSSE
jgi:hypothetical protein